MDRVTVRTASQLHHPLSPGSIPNPVVATQNLSTPVLRGLTVDIARGQFTVIMGPSGAGKTTLLRCLAGVTRPTSGSVQLDGIELTSLTKRHLAKLRRQRVGVISQSDTLVPALTVKENVTLSADLAKRRIDATQLRRIVNLTDLAGQLSARPATLSPFVRQRVACARTLVSQPDVIVADEPTGDLDTHSSTQVLEILRRAVNEYGQTIVLATHDPEVAAWADRIIFLTDGVVEAELANPTVESVLQAMGVLLGVQVVDDLPTLDSSRTEPPPPEVPAVQVREDAQFSSTGTGPIWISPRRADEQPDESSHRSIDAPTAIDAGVTASTQLSFGVEAPLATPTEDIVIDELAPVNLDEVLDLIAPSRPLAPETAMVVDQAQQILEDLPGSLLRADGQPLPANPQRGRNRDRL